MALSILKVLIQINLKWMKSHTKDSKYVQTNSVNLLFLIINKAYGCYEEINKNKYLTLIPTNESNELTKTYKEL